MEDAEQLVELLAHGVDGRDRSLDRRDAGHRRRANAASAVMLTPGAGTTVTTFAMPCKRKIDAHRWSMNTVNRAGRFVMPSTGNEVSTRRYESEPGSERVPQHDPVAHADVQVVRGFRRDHEPGRVVSSAPLLTWGFQTPCSKSRRLINTPNDVVPSVCR